MASRPRLKSVVVQYRDGQVVIWPRALQRMFIEDPSGHIAALLRILADGGCEAGHLPAEMARRGHPVAAGDITSVLGSLDELGVLEEAGGDAILAPATRDRHQSNLRYYDLFARLGRTSASFHQAIEQSRVLLLGAGGLGAGILQSLVGLGVGEVTLVDFDTVETRNLARQFVYGADAIGRPKVLAARDWPAYSPGTLVRPVHRRVTDAAGIAEAGPGGGRAARRRRRGLRHRLAGRHPPAGQRGLLRAGHPVRGRRPDLLHAVLLVGPAGPEPCRLCLELHREDEREAMPAVLREPPLIEPAPVNRATGPVVQLICGLMALEVMRYLTRTDPPVAAATYQVIELADGLETSRARWDRHPACPLCAPAARPAPEPEMEPGAEDGTLLAAARPAGSRPSRPRPTGPAGDRGTGPRRGGDRRAVCRADHGPGWPRVRAGAPGRDRFRRGPRDRRPGHPVAAGRGRPPRVRAAGRGGGRRAGGRGRVPGRPGAGRAAARPRGGTRGTAERGTAESGTAESRTAEQGTAESATAESRTAEPGSGRARGQPSRGPARTRRP